MNCPVCEQLVSEGQECGTCGWLAAGAGGAAELSVAILPELELTRYRAGSGGPSVRLAELETTQHEIQGVDLPLSSLPELELHRSALVPSGAAPAMEGVCRYCQNVQASGLLCERCGMRINRRKTAAPPAKAASPGEKVRCRACGAKTTAGEPCTDCGIPVPA